jgi:hypothetical protein
VDGSQTAGGVGTGGLSEAEGEVVDDDKAVGHTVGGGAGHTCDRSKLRASQFRIPIIYSDFNICYLKFSSGVWEIRFQVFRVSIFFAESIPCLKMSHCFNITCSEFFFNIVPHTFCIKKRENLG